MAAQTDKMMNDIKAMLDEETQLWLNNFKQGLVKLKTPQKGSLQLDESSVLESGDRLLAIIQNRFEVNMGKFELYARRNIFCSSSAVKKPAVSASSSGDLDDLRQTHAKLLQSQLELSAELEEATALRDNMLGVLQALQSGFAELQLGGKTLSETLGLQTEQLKKLHDLSSRANELASAINMGMVSGDDVQTAAGATVGAGITAGSSDELALLSQGLRNR
jgi:hypothetical protein